MADVQPALLELELRRQPSAAALRRRRRPDSRPRSTPETCRSSTWATSCPIPPHLGTSRYEYTGQEWDPEELIPAAAQVAQDRARQFAALLARPEVRDAAEVEADVEVQRPSN